MGMRHYLPRDHLVPLVDVEYDPVYYQSLIRVDAHTGCWVIDDCRNHILPVWHIEAASWRKSHPLRIAARLKLGQAPGKRPMVHSCGNENCVNLNHVDWLPVRSQMKQRNPQCPQITRDDISATVQQLKQQQFDEFTDWWRDYRQDPSFELPQWIEIEESYRIIIRTRPGELNVDESRGD